MTLTGQGAYEHPITITDADDISSQGPLRLYTGDNKITISSNKPLIGSYSYYDIVDEDYFNKEEGPKQDRVVLKELIIESVNQENESDDIINIKFKPNYKNSLTRYIIIIVRENSENTKDKLNNPCYITELLNKRPNRVKIETIYDVGEKDHIEAEVDIRNILHESNKYIVNIISQELRFQKKMNFYSALEFEHEGLYPEEEEESHEEEEEKSDQEEAIIEK